MVDTAAMAPLNAQQGRPVALRRAVIVLLGLLLVATGCEAEIEGSDGTRTRLDTAVQVRYSLGPDRAESLDLDEAMVTGPIHVFLAYLGSDVEQVTWTLDGTTVNEDASPPFDLVGSDGALAVPFDPATLLQGDHVVTAKIVFSSGATLEVEASFTAADGADDVEVPEGTIDVLSVNQQSFEDGIDGWRDQGNAVIDTTTSQAKVGKQALAATVSRNGMWTDDQRTSRVGTTPIGAAAGQNYTGQASVRVEDTASQARCEIRFYQNGKILETAPGPFAPAGGAGWTAVACTAKSPSGTTHVGLRVLVDEADYDEQFLVDDAHLWADPEAASGPNPPTVPAAAPQAAPAPAPSPTTTPPAPAAPAPAPAAPAPAPAPAPGRFPDASSTGPSGSLKSSSSVRVTQNGAVVENLAVSGSVTVEADNVTVRNLHIEATGQYGLKVTGKNVLIEDVEIDGQAACDIGLSPYGEWTARRLDVEGCVDGFGMKSNQVLEDSYCHDLRRYSGTHNDCIQTVGGTNSVIRGNNLNAPYHQTSCILIQTEFAPARNWLVENNRLSGGGYSISSRPKVHGTPTGITIRNNVFVRGSHQWGTHYLDVNDLSWSNNTWDDGSPVNR